MMVAVRIASALTALGIVAVRGHKHGYSEDAKKCLGLAAMAIGFICPTLVFGGGTVWLTYLFDKKYGDVWEKLFSIPWHPRERVIEDISEQQMRDEEEEERQQQWEVAQRRMADADLPKELIEEQLQWEHERIWNSVNTATKT